MWMMLLVLVQIEGAGTGVLRPALVTTVLGSPVVLEGTRSTAENLFAEVTIRNTSPVPITSVTFALTLGRAVGAGGEPIVRKTVSVAVALPPHAVRTLAVPSFGTRTALTGIAGTGGTAELSVIEVAFAEGAPWRAPLGASWVGRPDVVVPVRCGDATGVYAVGEVSVEGRTCGTDGRLRAATAGVK